MKNDKGTFETLLFKCPYEEFQAFDLKTKECNFQCKAKGNFQNPAECGEYYYCSRANAQPILASCPENWVFDGTGCNKDVNKCEYKPTTTRPEPDRLSASDTANLAVKALIAGLVPQIIEKICEVDTLNKDPEVCPANTAKASLVANNYKTEINDGNIYFVRCVLF